MDRGQHSAAPKRRRDSVPTVRPGRAKAVGASRGIRTREIWRSDRLGLGRGRAVARDARGFLRRAPRGRRSSGGRRAVGDSLFPVGEVLDSYYFLAVGASGRFYLVMDDTEPCGDDAWAAFDRIVG